MASPALPPEFGVAALVRVRRIYAGLTKRELGRRCGLSVAYVSALEAGRITPGVRAFARLAAELKFSPAEIMVMLAAEKGRPLRDVVVPEENGAR